MKEYLLYSQVQQRLNEHAKKHGKPVSFLNAVAELCSDSQTKFTDELPVVSFADWDCQDFDELRRLENKTPIDLEIFPADIREMCTAFPNGSRVTHRDVSTILLAQNQAMGLHRLQAFELYYVLHHTATLNTAAGSVQLDTGDICLVAPGFLHDVVTGDADIVMASVVAERVIENALSRVLQNENIISDFLRTTLSRGAYGFLQFRLPITKYIGSIIRTLFDSSNSRKPYSDQIHANCIEVLSCLLLQNADQAYMHCYKDWGESPSSLLPILRFIQANYRNITLKETATRFHYEPSYLGKLLKTYVGKTYTELVASLRITEAKKLLADFNISIEAVAESAGFHSAAQFSRSFRQQTGQTPSQYRKSLLYNTV